MSEYPAQGVAHSAAYTYTLTDYQAARRARRALSPIDQVLWRWRYLLMLGINMIALPLYTIWAYELTAEDVLSWDYISWMLPVFLGLVVFIALTDAVFDWVLVPWIFNRLAIANKSLAMAFNNDGIFWSSEGLKGELAWSNVVRIVTLEGYLFLFISKLEALCVPKRAFASENAFNSLVTYAKERANG